MRYEILLLLQEALRRESTLFGSNGRKGKKRWRFRVGVEVDKAPHDVAAE